MPAGMRWGSALSPREREPIALLLRLHLKAVTLKLHKKCDYYKTLRPLPGGLGPAPQSGKAEATISRLTEADFRSIIKAATETRGLSLTAVSEQT